MKTAIVCDWLVTFAGAEKVLTALIDCFPAADLFAVIDFLTPESRAFIKTTVCAQILSLLSPFNAISHRTVKCNRL